MEHQIDLTRDLRQAFVPRFGKYEKRRAKGSGGADGEDPRRCIDRKAQRHGGCGDQGEANGKPPKLSIPKHGRLPIGTPSRARSE